MARHIVMIGSAAAAETVSRIESCREELLKVYSRAYIDRALSINKGFCRDMAEVSEEGETTEGGIYRALWRLGVQENSGFEVFFDRVPIDQGAIEMADHFDYDPYDQASGAVLVVTDREDELPARYEKAGIPAAIIGYLTDNNDRVIINGEIRRFLTPDGKD